MAQRVQISIHDDAEISGLAYNTGMGVAGSEQRHVKLRLGDATIDLHVFGDAHTRQLMKALAGASGGLLATLPDEPGPLGERDESAVAVERERWPSVAEVAGEVHGGVSCGYSGCTPADPCGACQTLAGAQGAGTQGGER